MKREVIFIILIFTVFISKAQKLLLIKPEYLPNHVYVSRSTNNFRLEIGGTGDSTEINDFLNITHVKRPPIVKMESAWNFELNTGLSKSKNTFPITYTITKRWYNDNINVGQNYDDTTSTIWDENGKVILGPLTGKRLYGMHQSDGEIKMESFKNDDIDEYLKSFIAHGLNRNNNPMFFLKKGLKVGDTISSRRQFGGPMFNVLTDLYINSIYKLTAIKKNLAYFDIDLSASVDPSASKLFNIVMQGTGTGKMIYDIDQRVFTLFKGNLDYNYKITLQKAVITGKGKIAYGTDVKVRSN
jgi:hypothetical protein